MFILIFATLFAPFLLASSSAASLSSRIPRISTTSGILSGSSTDNIHTFLGIPYAQPPVGDLRWQTALPINSSRTAFDATQFGAGCGQLLLPGYGSVFSTANITPLPTNQSEDCLSLNIWAPKNAKSLPVIIFVHGGAYQSGVSSTAIYHGDHVAETGRAIFVSINYRLNIWGFPSSTPVDGLDQNIGITDVRLAIEWVATNIAQFGGDPAQIIFSGHSAGAGIGEELLYAFDKDPIFVGQIAISGSVGQLVAAPTDGTSWNLVSNALGCGNSTDASQVSCMKNITFDQINNATLQLKTYFGPFTDGTIILDNAAYLARGENGSFAHVPALISNVNDEGSLFIEPYSSFEPNGTTADSVADPIVCSEALEALNKRKANIPTWRVRYMAQWPNLEPFPNDSSVGVWHVSDIPIAFGTYAGLNIGNGTITKDEQLLSARLMDAWLTFAKNPKDGLSNRLGWPLYDPNGDTLVKIGEHNSSSFSFGPSTQYDSTCPK